MKLQVIFCFAWISNKELLFLQRCLTCPVMSQLIQIYIITFYHFTIIKYFNIALETKPVFSKLVSCLMFIWIKFFCTFLISPTTLPRLAKQIHPLPFHHPSFSWRLQTIEHFATQFSPNSCCFHSLTFVYSPLHPVAQTPQFNYFFTMKEKGLLL